MVKKTLKLMFATDKYFLRRLFGMVSLCTHTDNCEVILLYLILKDIKIQGVSKPVET